MTTEEEGLAQTSEEPRPPPLCPSPAASVNLKSGGGGSFQGHPFCQAFKRMQREFDILGRTRSYLTAMPFNRETSLAKPEVLFWRIKRESDRASLFMTFMSHCSRGSLGMAKILEKLHFDPNPLSALISRPISTRACANSPLSSRFRPFPPFSRPSFVPSFCLNSISRTQFCASSLPPSPPAHCLCQQQQEQQPPRALHGREGETDESERASNKGPATATAVKDT